MNSHTETTLQPETASRSASADKASKFLSNLGRFTATSPATALTRDEAKPAAQAVVEQPVMRAVEPPLAGVASPASTPSSSDEQGGSRSRTPRKKSVDSDRIERTFEVVAGKGSRVLTARIPRELHARVYLVATTNRFAERDAPHTINQLVQDALHEWLAKHDAA